MNTLVIWMNKLVVWLMSKLMSLRVRKRSRIDEIYDEACADARAFLEQELRFLRAQLKTSAPTDIKTREALYRKAHKRADERMNQIMQRAKEKVDSP